MELSPAQIEALYPLTIPKWTQYIPHAPTVKQQAALLIDRKEILYGGAAGGGKSDMLLMAALQYVDEPGYNAILFRRTYADLALADSLMDRADQWLRGTDAVWNGTDHKWRFPSGASVTFAHMQHEKDKFNYKSAAFQFIGFDELTSFSEGQYRYLFSRLRRLAGVTIPLRCWSASNPGDTGHSWVKSRFVDKETRENRIFLPAGLQDNPHLDAEEYMDSLENLFEVEKRQLREGDWEVQPEGKMFKRAWFKIVEHKPDFIREVTYWDFAATEPGGQNKDPDFTAGCMMGKSKSGGYYITNMITGQWGSKMGDDTVHQVAMMNGRNVQIGIEQEPGSSGKKEAERMVQKVLAGFSAKAYKETGNKAVRAKPLAVQAEAGNVYLVMGPWVQKFLDEICAFPSKGIHDDQVDAASGAFRMLTGAQVGISFL